MSLPATAPRALRRAIAADQAQRGARRHLRTLRQLAQRNAEVRAGHRRLRTGLWPYLYRAELATLLTAPIIYSVAVPFVMLDAWVWIYQAVCFRAWGIRPVRRRAYFAIDRHKLAYLNTFEKFNCLFCSYANGLIAYVREVAARTEQYLVPDSPCPAHTAAAFALRCIRGLRRRRRLPTPAEAVASRARGMSADSLRNDARRSAGARRRSALARGD